MSREEIVNNIGYQMTMAAKEYIEKHEFADAMDAFEAGAEWMQKQMIDKAWDWFYNMALNYMSGDITDVKWGSMKEDFFKAMEK